VPSPFQKSHFFVCVNSNFDLTEIESVVHHFVAIFLPFQKNGCHFWSFCLYEALHHIDSTLALKGLTNEKNVKKLYNKLRFGWIGLTKININVVITTWVTCSYYVVDILLRYPVVPLLKCDLMVIYNKPTKHQKIFNNIALLLYFNVIKLFFNFLKSHIVPSVLFYYNTTNVTEIRSEKRGKTRKRLAWLLRREKRSCRCLVLCFGFLAR